MDMFNMYRFHGKSVLGKYFSMLEKFMEIEELDLLTHYLYIQYLSWSGDSYYNKRVCCTWNMTLLGYVTQPIHMESKQHGIRFCSLVYLFIQIKKTVHPVGILYLMLSTAF